VTDTDRASEIDYYYEDGDLVSNPANYFNDWERHHLEDELWGDDDRIIGSLGDGTASYGEWIWGGDGDDWITSGYGFGSEWVWGGDGNDKIEVLAPNVLPSVRGGRGDDVITTPTYKE
jgi:hypothetical protein